VTIFVVSWIVRFADAYIGPSSSFGLFLLQIVGDTHKYPGYIAGYLVVVLLIMLLGFLVTRATVARFHRAIDSLFAKIPLVGKIIPGGAGGGCIWQEGTGRQIRRSGPRSPGEV
jgi:uncharacterized membrane protein